MRYLIAIPLSIVGVWYLWQVVWCIWCKAHWSAWRPVIAEVLQSTATGGPPGAYRWRIRYQYTVEGQSHVGDRLSITPEYPGMSYADTISSTQRYPVGSRMQVRHHPGRPHRSAMRAAKWSELAWGLFTSVLLVLFALLAYLTFD